MIIFSIWVGNALKAVRARGFIKHRLKFTCTQSIYYTTNRVLKALHITWYETGTKIYYEEDALFRFFVVVFLHRKFCSMIGKY